MKRSPYLWPVLAGLVLVTALGAAVVLTRSSGDEPTRPTTTTVPADPTAPPTSVADERPREEAVVIIDGWSHRILGDQQLRLTESTGFAATPEFKPADADEVAELRERAPQAVAAVVARLAPLATAVSCEDICRAGDVEITDEMLAEPATIPGLGPVYAGWEIGAGVWVARVSVPVDAALSLAPTAGDWTGATLLTGGPPDPDVQDSGDPTPDASNGFFQRTFPVAAGLGRLFALSPSWIEPEPATIRPSYDPTRPVVDVTQLTSDPTAFAGGLAAFDPGSAYLSNSALAYLTSPSTGCGAGVLCVPTAAAASVAVSARDLRWACDLADSSRLPVLFEDATWSYDFPHPTHQAGVWEGASPDPVAADPMLFSGTPHLTQGPQSFRVTTATVFNPDASRVQVRGQVLHVGFDTPASLEEPAPAIFDRLLPLGTRTWCSAPDPSIPPPPGPQPAPGPVPNETGMR